MASPSDDDSKNSSWEKVPFLGRNGCETEKKGNFVVVQIRKLSVIDILAFELATNFVHLSGFLSYLISDPKNMK